MAQFLRKSIPHKHAKPILSRLIGVGQRCGLLTLAGLMIGGCDRRPVSYEKVVMDHSDVAPAEEWRHYLGDSAFSHYSKLGQINTSNVHLLEEIWRYDSGGAGADGTTQMQCSPIVVRGVLYCTSPLLHAFAIDAATGRELWRFEPA